MATQWKIRRSSPAILLSALLGITWGEAVEAQDTAQGQNLYQTYCAACHAIGSRGALGPDLEGVHERREHDWLLAKIVEPGRLVAEGDPVTMELIDEYGMAMAALGVTSDQAESILAYLEQFHVAEAPDPAATPDGPMEAPTYTDEQVALGGALFHGRTRLENRGPSCNACHNVDHPDVLGGGNLSVDLTDAYSRMGAPGVSGMMASAPFPVMRRAYEGRSLTDEEIQALTAFLQRVDQEPGDPPAVAYGPMLLGAGAGGVLILMGLFTFAWRGRRRGALYKDVFDRQVKST